MDKLARNIKKLRKADGLSQEDFAEKVGVTRQTISKWEKYGDIKSKNIDNICKVYNISSEQLMGDNDYEIKTVNRKTGKEINRSFKKQKTETDDFNKNDASEINNNIVRNEENKASSIESNKENNDNKILFQNQRIKNPYIYPIKNKRHKIKKRIKALIIFTLLLYILISLYKFAAICFIIHKQQKYKNVNNYYEEKITIINNIMKEQRRIWYKDNKCKIEIVKYDDAGNYKEKYTRFYSKDENKKITINELDNSTLVQKLNENSNYLYFDNIGVFNELPWLFRDKKIYLLFPSFKINVNKNKIFLYYNTNKIEVSKDSYLPMSIIDNSKLGEEIYYKYGFNSVTDNDVSYKK